jgi:hypothetical protein
MIFEQCAYMDYSSLTGDSYGLEIRRAIYVFIRDDLLVLHVTLEPFTEFRLSR